MIAPARRAAYRTLRAIADGRLDLPSAFAQERDQLGDARDRALAGEIVLGVLRWRGALDFAIERLAMRPVARLDAEVLDILRSGLYQLWQLERVPPAAVVNDAVALTRVAHRGRASALVNAALRAFTRTRMEALLPLEDGTAEALAVRLSHPRWLVERWLKRFDYEDVKRWLAFNNSHAPLTLRINTARSDALALQGVLAEQHIEADLARYAPDALTINHGNPLGQPAFSAGEFIVQDEASQLVAHMARVQQGERVLDACASPGGKTLVMSNTMRSGFLVAADVRGRRVTLLESTLRRTGTTASLVQLDLREPLPFPATFDCILVDAPCSGLGTVRRDPDIKWRRAEQELRPLADVQTKLLGNAAAGVRPGGRLVYATCSSEPEENDQVVDRFLAEQAGRFREAGPEWVRQTSGGLRLADVCDVRGRLRTLPHAHGLEAFFGAVLVKAERI